MDLTAIDKAKAYTDYRISNLGAAGFKILGYYSTVAQLQTGVANPTPGMIYGVGDAPPYQIYVYDGITSSWINNGQIQGPQGIQGEQGPIGISAGFGIINASVDNTVGTPSVDVSSSGSNQEKNINFAFSNLKGEKGDKGDIGATGPYFTPSVSNEGVISWTNNGELDNPSSVNIKGPQGIQGIQGEKGNKGDKGDKGEKGDKGDKGSTGDSVTITNTVISYQNGASSSQVPTGTWLTSIPSEDLTKPYLWTKVYHLFSTGDVDTYYSCANRGASGATIVTVGSDKKTNLTMQQMVDILNNGGNLILQRVVNGTVRYYTFTSGTGTSLTSSSSLYFVMNQGRNHYTVTVDSNQNVNEAFVSFSYRTIKSFSANLSTSWVGSSSPYSQEITVNGVSINGMRVILDLGPSTLQKMWENGYNFTAKITASDTITIYCIGNKPTESLQISGYYIGDVT